MRRFASLLLLTILLTFGISRPGVASNSTVGLGDVEEFSQRGDTFDINTSTGATIQIQVLTNDIFRIWVGPNGELTDEGSHAAPIILPCSYQPVNARAADTGEYHLITTSEFVLAVKKSPLLFALYRPDKTALIWRELKPLHLSAEGSYQTLSSSADERFFGGGQQNGSFEFKGRVMEISYSGGWEEGDRPSPAPFYISSCGYGVLRNTWAEGRYDFWSTDYLTTTHQENRFDAYYFVGQSINDVVRLYTQLTGRAGLLPRWAFEFGDADCYNDRDNIDKPGTVPPGWTDGPTGTTPDVIATVAAKYREHDMPGGWILPNDGYGCGYTDLPGVVKRLRELGFHTGLWTESGLDKIAWEVGQAGTRVQKLDVAWTGKGYQFALDANMEAAKGILDNSNSRPFVWTVMGWAGIQRYAVTWTGDQSGSWDYIRWHIPTLIGSGLSGMTYSTGDVDGIYGGSPETYTRDLQWKCFTPVLMGMSGWSKNERKHPWWFEEPYRSINRKYLKLKMRLTPYMYTLAREAAQTGAPIVRGLMWDHPDDFHAYSEAAKYQFLLGCDLLIAPVFRSQSSSNGWRDSIYLPSGDWIDYWSGEITRADTGGLWIDYPVTLEKLPIFVRAGAILPMYPEALYDDQVPMSVLTLDVYPSGESEYTLYEDDGNTRAYKDGAFSQLRFHVSQSGTTGLLNVSIGSVQGHFEGMNERRQFILQIHSPNDPRKVAVNGRLLAETRDSSTFGQASGSWYFAAEDRHGIIYIKTDMLSVSVAHIITVEFDSGLMSYNTAALPEKPRGDGSISADNLLVVSRPAEEPGYPLENAFDSNPATWFRTVRDQSVSYGPHEFVISLKKRRVIDGFQIAPRTDKWWKYGQVNRYELYVGDVNGNWGDPVIDSSFSLSTGVQTVRFAPAAGRLVRFRVLSVHDPDADSTMAAPTDGPVDVLAPVTVRPVTISEFRLLEHQLPDEPPVVIYLADKEWKSANGAGGAVAKYRSGEDSTDLAMHMSGLPFGRGVSARGDSRIDYELHGDWQTFRAEAGIDDRTKDLAEVRFQIFGDDRLLYDSGPVKSPQIAKVEVDVRGIKALSLRTTGAAKNTIIDWANASVSGYADNGATR